MEIKQFVLEQKEKIKNEVESLKVKPCMMIIQVNEDAASNAYIKGKIKDCNEVGINCILNKLPLDITQEDLLKEIEKANNDKTVHGLIVQMPLPRHIDEEVIKLAVNPKKDIDGFHPLSSFVPCTPKGIITYLKAEGIDFNSKNAVVIGRSNIVGKPLAKLLTSLNCNTTVLHSRTTKEDMDFYLRHADIVCVAVGRKWFLNKETNLKPSAVVVDVGINREDGKLYGDCQEGLNVLIQTPVPGGVGLLTRLSLLENLMEAYKNGI